MSAAESPVESIYFAALAKESPQEVAAYLDEACGADAELRRRVERLLQAQPKVGSFLEGVAPAPEPTAAQSEPLEIIGMVIGPYKLLQQIGEGGMGTVWMAQQTEPVKRVVALKLIKAGMDSKQVIARFEAERQALALMDHPNIAKVLDGGTTDRRPHAPREESPHAEREVYVGRPYFVMDLVKGVPITKYCDEHHLTPQQRLELFIPVCQAVQHAHQKGIIHRDLKPSNVLVALYDGKPVPKVIDFGVAKAAGQPLTDKTLVTGFGNIVGTLEYMSPEQAEVNQLDIDTRSDVYSLGVLLYELLTGTTPLEHKRVQERGMLEALRIIREEEVPTLSNRLSSTDELPAIAASRGTEPAKLTKLVRGELNWIVMKCLEKDRNRRYETANGFAMDLQRYLADEPVLACPPSAAYRFRKFARRNMAALVMTSVIGVALLLAVGSLGWTVRDQAARQSRIGAQVDLILGEVDQLEREQKWAEALAAARRAEAAVAGGEADAATAQWVRALLKDLEFIERLEQIRMQRATWVEGTFDYAGAVREYAWAFHEYGVNVEELPVETSIDRLKAGPALAIPLAAALDDWSYARRVVSAVDVAGWERLVAVARGIDPEPLRNRLRETWGQSVAPEAQDELRRLADSIDIRAHHPATLVSLARTLQGVKHPDSALRLLRHAQYVYPGDFWLNFTLGFVLNEQRDHDGAIRFYTAAVSIRPSSAAVHCNLGFALSQQKKLDEAIASYRKAIDLDPNHAIAYGHLGAALRDQKKVDEAIAAYHKAIEFDPKNARAHYNLGHTLHEQKKLDEAIAAYHKAIELDPNYANAYSNLGLALREQKKLPEAIAAFRKAIEVDPKHAHAYSNLGGALVEQNELPEAVAAMRKAIAIDPKNAGYYSNLGVALLGQKKLDEAIDAFRKASEIDPKNAFAHYSLGVALLGQKKLDEAINAFRKASEIDPRFYFGLGHALREQKKLDEAIAAFRKAIELNPQFASARDGLALCLSEMAWALAEPAHRDPGRAVNLAKEAVELTPGSSLAWQYLGWIHYRTGNWKSSIEALEKSCTLQAGGTGDAGQWIVLALAHARLAGQEGLPEKERAHHQAEARRRYEQADKYIDSLYRVRPGFATGQAIWDFRAEARELLGVKEKKE